MDLEAAERRLREIHYIKNELAFRGLTLNFLDRKNGFPIRTCSEALYRANAKGEEAIAAALGVRPHTLWPERYDPLTGQRHSPQHPDVYRRAPSKAEIRKMREAQS